MTSIEYHKYTLEEYKKLQDSRRPEELQEIDLIIEKLAEFTLFFKKTFDLDVYLYGGTLLGAVRENDIIFFDADIDVAYLSKTSTAEGVKEELRNLTGELKDKKMLACFMSEGHFYVWPESGSFCCRYSRCMSHKPGSIENNAVAFDIYPSWMENDHLYLPFKIAGSLPGEALLPFRKCLLRNQEFYIPNWSEKICEYTYGTDWKTPIFFDSAVLPSSKGIKEYNIGHFPNHFFSRIAMKS